MLQKHNVKYRIDECKIIQVYLYTKTVLAVGNSYSW